MVQLTLSYQEALFSPAETAACTGLSFANQRDWRRQGHLPQHAAPAPLHLFTPRQLVEIRIMLKLRHLGIGPSAAKPLAEQAASSVLYLALGEHNGGWGVDAGADQDRAERYVQAMKPDWDARVRMISKVGEKVLRYGVLTEDAFTWLEERPKPPRAEPEVSGQISLSAIAKALVQVLPKPMVLILIPKGQGG